MGSEARLLLRAPLGVVEVEQKRALNHVGERLRASLAEEALQDGEDARSAGAELGESAKMMRAALDQVGKFLPTLRQNWRIASVNAAGSDMSITPEYVVHAER